MRAELFAVALLGLVLPGQAASSFSGSITLEGRWFMQQALDADQADSNLSVSVLPEYVRDWDGGRQRFVFKPFARVDQRDAERTHFDVREAVWSLLGDGWEIRAGVDKVFWGVTEVNHLVDVVNQTDLLENPDGEQKLGQPMVKGTLEGDWGLLDVFVLPLFRERPFPGQDGRLRTQPRVADELARYRSGAGERHVDFAVRWAHSIDAWDLALGYFRGTGRAPALVPGLDRAARPALVPVYDIVDRASLELQGALGEWLWKFEGLWESGSAEEYLAATGGFEYTLVGVAETQADLGVLAEFMVDERGRRATTPFNNDVFLGIRLAVNDAPGTELLTGMVVDWDTGARFFNLEASRRLGADWKVAVQARAWFDVPRADPLFSFRQDDYVEAQLIRYF